MEIARFDQISAKWIHSGDETLCSEVLNFYLKEGRIITAVEGIYY
jgi:hypothetical protein